MNLRGIRIPSRLLFVLVLALAIVATYWQVLKFPFIQDDWDLLLHFHTNDPATVIHSILSFGGKLFYRPLSQLYLFLMYNLFGLNSLPFHLVALLVHFLNALLVAGIVKAVSDNDRVAHVAGLLYALSISVHLEPLMWAVGIYDLGGACFFFLSLRFFLNKRPLCSAVAYLVALLFKETTVFLPAILLGYVLIQDVPLGLAAMWKKYRLTFLPYLLVFGLYLFVKRSALPLSLPVNHPYAVDLWGAHLGRNLYAYAAWLVQTVFPFWYIQTLPFKLLFTLSILLATLVAWISRREWDPTRRKMALFALIWLVVSLLPLLLLPNHSYRYYLTYALPPFVAGFALLADTFLSTMPRLRPHKTWFLMAGVALVLIAAVLQGQRIVREGLDQVTWADGTNGLVKRAATVDIVRADLHKYLPALPDQAVILLGGVDLWAFGKDSGPQVWYDSLTLRVYALEDLRSDAAGIYVDSPTEDQTQTYTGSAQNRIDLDPANTFAFRLSGAELLPVQSEEIATPRD